MKARVSSALRESTLLRYVLVGGVGYLFEMLVLFVAAILLHQSSAVSVTASYWLGLLFSFLLQKLLAFKNTDTRPGALSAQTLMYAALVLFNYAFTLGFAALTTPIIGLFLSRTIALLITTLWNYFLYKIVIFGNVTEQAGDAAEQKLASGIRRIAEDRGRIVLAVVAVTTATLFMLMSLGATFVADDYSYLASIRNTGNPAQYLFDHYVGHNGRLSQNVLVTGGFVFFGARVLQVIPFALFAGISLALAWVLALILPTAVRRRSLTLTLGPALLGAALLSLPSLFDSYLWLTSSTVYLGSLMAFLVNLGIVITLARKTRVTPVALIATLIVLALGQSFSEPVALIAIAAAGVWLLSEVIQRSARRVRLSAYVLAALIAGFLVVYLSPGTTIRRAAIDNPFSLRQVVFGPFEHYSTLVQNFSWWSIALLIGLSLITALHLGPLAKRRKFVLASVALAGVVFFASTYMVFAVSMAASPLIPFRNFTIPVFGLALTIYIVMVLMCKLSLDLLRGSASRVVAVGLAALVLLAAFPFVLSAVNVQLQGLALRESQLAARSADLVRLSGDENPIEVIAAPVLVVSQAVEIENPPRDQVDWLINSFRAWHEIPQSTEVIPLPTPAGYCLPAVKAVKPEFVCGVTTQ